MGDNDPGAAKDLRAMCAEDSLFYINAFVWTYDPRLPISDIPFVTYDYQDAFVDEINDCIAEKEDLFIEKSRDMGATWTLLVAYDQKWRFFRGREFLLGSRKEDLVDRRGDSAALFWKLDFIEGRLPRWLRPKQERSKLKKINLSLNSGFTGESTNDDFGRAGRYTAVLPDEFAAADNGHLIIKSMRDSSPSCHYNSTPQGTGNEHYRVGQRDGIRKRVLHWTMHPIKAEGLYYVDPENPRNRWFVKGKGNPRSPWYDKECLRRTPEEIAQELDIDYLGASYQFFGSESIRQYISKNCRQPYRRGALDYDHASLDNGFFMPRGDGPLCLWTIPGEDGLLDVNSRYAIGVDVAFGTGASYSVISIGDRTTKELVAQWDSKRIKPHELADLATALARWANDALVIWEANGPGREFGDRMMQNKYANIYWRTREESVSKKRSDIPGFWMRPESKVSVLGEYRRALSEADFMNRSEKSVRDCNQYIVNPGQKIVHAKSNDKINPTKSGANHGDHVISAALLWHVLKVDIKPKKVLPAYPRGSYGHRRKARRDAVANAGAWN